ncbi:unnamed protein product, partial [Allacma fusca]
VCVNHEEYFMSLVLDPE